MSLAISQEELQVATNLQTQPGKVQHLLHLLYQCDVSCCCHFSEYLLFQQLSYYYHFLLAICKSPSNSFRICFFMSYSSGLSGSLGRGMSIRNSFLMFFSTDDRTIT